MKKTPAPLKLTKIFGLIAHADNNDVLLCQSLTPLQPILDMIAVDCADDDIYKQYKGIKPQEIRTAKTYFSRFGPEAQNPAPLPLGPKAFLFDECLPTALVSLSNQIFGFSSHVELEGLSRQNPHHIGQVHRKMIDSHIAEFALKNQFAAIATRDTDYIALHKMPKHAASKLHIILLKTPSATQNIEQTLQQKSDLLRRAIAKDTPGLFVL